jgi:hypothetical protein
VTRATVVRYSLMAVLVLAGSANLVLWWAWLVVGILQGGMTTEAGPGRAW